MDKKMIKEVIKEMILSGELSLAIVKHERLDDMCLVLSIDRETAKHGINLDNIEMQNEEISDYIGSWNKKYV